MENGKQKKEVSVESGQRHREDLLLHLTAVSSGWFIFDKIQWTLDLVPTVVQVAGAETMNDLIRFENEKVG